MIAALALAFATPALAQTTSNPSANEIRAENCMVKFINNVNVPAEVEVKLMELKFDEGSTVAAGEIMAVIDDTQAKFALELKKAEERRDPVLGTRKETL